MARAIRRRANLQAQLRYGPEMAALRQMQREEDAQLVSGLAFEDAAAAGIIRAALRSTRPTKKAYRRSAQARKQAYGRAETDLAGLSDAADPYRAGLLRERALSRALTSTARARAIEELQDRRSEARAGQVFNQRNLRSTHLANVGKIRLREAELRRERGAFKADTYEDLLAAQREANLEALKFREQKRATREDERIARQREARIQADANEPDEGPARLTPSQRRGYRDDFETALLEARGLKGVPVSRLQRYLVEEVSVSPLIALAAAQAARGGADPNVARRVRRRYGLRVPKRKAKPKPPRSVRIPDLTGGGVDIGIPR